MLLFLLNPGRQSRHYILGLIRAAQRLGLRHFTIDLTQIWDHLNSAEDKQSALRSVHAELHRLVATHKPTHAIGYAYNGTIDIGVVSRGTGVGRAFFPSAGVRQILLWTDHPEWISDGIALHPPALEVLRDPLLTHFVKSQAAAEEATQVLRWPNIHWTNMAEDYQTLLPVRGIEPTHDVVAILGDARGISPAITRFLTDDDPDPAAMDDAMRPAALSRFTTPHPSLSSLANAWLDAKRADPFRSFWSLAGQLGHEHQSALLHLRETPTRWYSAITALRTMVSWRRFFWPAWLARRVNVGIYGSDASPLGIPQNPGAADWVPYERQPEIYARGRVALNTNAAHDEEGLTHKPFQIAASGVPLLHHHTRGLSDCFEIGREALSFSRGPELLEAVRSLADNRAGSDLADRALTRAKRDHTWEARLQSILSREPASSPVAI